MVNFLRTGPKGQWVQRVTSPNFVMQHEKLFIVVSVLHAILNTAELCPVSLIHFIKIVGSHICTYVPKLDLM